MISKALFFVNTYIVSPALPVTIFAAGLYYIFRLKAFIFFHPVKIIKSFFTSDGKDGISPFRAVTLALAGTLGVGNIVGVASAISIGGPGAVFWMWVSSVASMFIKYVETLVAMMHRKREGNIYHGGAYYYIKNAFVAGLFAVLCLIASFLLGNLIQIRALADSAMTVFKIPAWSIAIFAAIFCLIVTVGGVKRISALTVRMIPALAFVYIAISMYIICKNFDQIPHVITLILGDAFGIDKMAAGTSGFIISKAIRYGISRGLVSNEAGCGTAPIAHAASQSQNPVRQGFWGIFEVFCDTVLLCSMTAFCVLFAYGTPAHDTQNGMIYVLNAYEMLAGKGASYIIGISVCLFAVATVLCWAHYGSECIYYLTGKFTRKTFRTINNAYLILYSITAAAGAFVNAEAAWTYTELIIGIMTIINTIYIFRLSNKVTQTTNTYFGREVRGRGDAQTF